MVSTTFDASDWSIDSLHDRFGDLLRAARPVTNRVAYLDSFDWRIYRTGARLSMESAGRRKSLRWVDENKDPYVLPIATCPDFATDIPPGFLRERLQRILKVRRLFVMGTNRVVTSSFQILDEDGDSAVRLSLDELTPIDQRGKPVRPPYRILTVRTLEGRESEARTAVKALVNDGAVRAPGFDPLVVAAGVVDREPGEYRSKPQVELKYETKISKATRSILKQLLETLLANVEGVVRDLDIEFLHDLRVATRRTRSALSQIKKVLPKKEVRHFAAEFKWLGEITGPHRDLDVNLVEMDGFRREMAVEDATIEPLRRLLKRSRAAERRRVKRALESKRFHALVSDWSEFLDKPPKGSQQPASAHRPVGEVADERILKAYLRMVERGAKLGDDPDPATLHRLRIDGKKLRYLLEFFASLYPRKELAPLVKDLKRLQNVLGGFNDMEVQQARLAAFADRLIEEGDTRSDTVFAMGRLADAMNERQDEYRLEFATRFEVFSSRDNRRTYHRLFEGKD